MFWKKKQLDWKEQYQECVNAFLRHDYQASLTYASQLMAAQRLNFEILLLSLISMMRLTDMAKVRNTYTKLMPHLANEKNPAARWHEILFRLLFGDATLAEALRSVEDNRARCQAHFCEGIRKLNLADQPGAEREFQTCLDLGVECLEAKLAASQKKLLAGKILVRA
jgi:hypothetical protein